MNLKNDDAENSNSLSKLITDKNKSEEEIQYQVKEFAKSFSEVLKPILENAKQTKKELEEE